MVLLVAQQSLAKRGPGPELTETQRTCLESQIGKPGEGERPSREKMEAALKLCKIDRPPRPPHHQDDDEPESEGQAFRSGENSQGSRSGQQ